MSLSGFSVIDPSSGHEIQDVEECPDLGGAQLDCGAARCVSVRTNLHEAQHGTEPGLVA